MGLSTYSELQTAIADWLNRTDLTSRIPDFIRLAEGDIRADLMSRNVTRNTTLTVSGAETVLPADIKFPRSLYVADGRWAGPVLLVAPETIADKNRQYPSGGPVPRWAAIVNGVLLVAPVPSEAVTLSVVYEPQLIALEHSSTNWLLQEHPSVYLYGALTHSAPYLRDDERVALWRQGYLDTINKMEGARDRYEFGAGPLVAMPRKAIGG